MKNTMKKLLVLMLAMVCVLGLVACAPAPVMDLDDASDNLEDEDYTVFYNEDGDESEGIEETLYASNDDDHLIIIRFKKASTAKLYYKNLKNTHNRELKSIKANIKYQENLLKNYDGDMDSDTEDYYEDSIKEKEKDIKESKEYVYGIRGKTVWYGTKDAIKDSKG